MVLLLTDTVGMTRRVGAYVIASSLRKENIEVEVIDYLSKWNFEKLIELLDSIKNLEWVGISLTYLFYHSHKDNPKRMTDLPYDKELELIDYFRKRGIPIILGGANADTIKNYVNNFYIVVGYSDRAIVKFHRHITRNEQLIYESVNENKVVFADKHYGDIDLGTIDVNYSHDDMIIKDELIPLEISRGCVFKCKFCEFAYLGKKPGTYIRSKASIKQDILHSHTEFNSSTFLFADDTFNDSVEKMQMIKEIREELKIPFRFWAYGRLDLLARYPQMMDLIGDIGWTAVTFGVETMNKQTGSAVGKGADPERLKKCLLEIKQRYPHMHIQANLIVGLPHSTKEDILETVNWFLDNNIANYLRVVDLDLRDPTNLTSSSEFSADPAKFGYEIISTDTLRYNWSTKGYWTTARAKEYADEINQYIDSRKPVNIPFHVGYFLNRGFKNHRDYISNSQYFAKKTQLIDKKNREL